ncbi:DUF3320 domain-containing protein [Paracoccus hibiscisoli]|uniref:DUF3320 domain-containing protein n=1 Tax=Paracoccus hibiscisoli TaxID=2023261 RepID=A0A4U0QMG3_9RHOB|nr:DUF3320 domain-containing protein [Paracoccus hibiscisoli]TJZ82896.1 DUF3320 domain-containing protein [Paracoccus hibiscisoli]
MTQALTRTLDAARRKLLETGTRNRLIHVNRDNQRANCLNIIHERSDEIWRLLRLQGKRMRFRAMGCDTATPDGVLLLAAPGAEAVTDSQLETPMGPEALARRLLRLSHDARTAEEEQGLNVLYLAMGFLRWREAPGSQVLREAPLILLPVQLVRNERSSTFDLCAREDDLAANLPLQERLRQDFGIHLPEIDETETWTPGDYLTRVEEAVSGQRDWQVDRDGMQLGFFSFAKLLMHRDLDPANWPEGSFDGNALLDGLLARGFAGDAPLFGDRDRLDDRLDPAQIIQVIDADASQTKVIEEVRAGASLVVQGPPGTGKSQTITNIIAAAAHDGKTVLFVAEKMAALSVVHDRLTRAGLRDICLELHSRSANKKALAQELGRTLMAGAHALPPAADPARLRQTRDRLNAITALLHDPLPPSDEPPFAAISSIIGLMGQGARAPAIPLAGLEALDAAARATAQEAIARFVAARARTGPPEAHPFRGTGALDLQPTDLARLGDDLRGAQAALAAVGDRAQVAQALGRDAPGTLDQAAALAQLLTVLARAPQDAALHAGALFAAAGDPRLAQALQAGADWATAQAQARFTPAAFEIDPGPLRDALARGVGSVLGRFFGPYRGASAQLRALLTQDLPPDAAGRLALADQLVALRRLRRALADEEGYLAATLGAAWRGERTPFAALAAVALWLRGCEGFADGAAVTRALAALDDPQAAGEALDQAVRAARGALAQVRDRLAIGAGAAPLGDDAALADAQAALSRMAGGLARYAEWADLARQADTARRHGAGAVIDAVAAGHLDPQEAATEFAYACAEARWNAARQARPGLNELPHLDRHDLVTLFRQLETERIETTKTLILSRHFDQLPRGTQGEMGLIRGEIARRRGHKPVRWLMAHAGPMVQRIKPVMLMSPISVAQFLPPDAIRFDLLVIDEASQIRPEDALGVIARARQIVVVGDQKQLPPTSFFDRLVDDAEDMDDPEDGPQGANVADMESILSLCEARGLRSRMLEWHYRSRDPSLIRVSNAEFYDDRLVLPPSPLQLDPDYGLKFRRVSGAYAARGSGQGRAGTNRIEAEAVVAAMADHARRWPGLSLGVVAFSKAQADMLTEIADAARRRDPALDALLREGGAEDVFVKNIENVQGDERDVILISVGYGPSEPDGPLTRMQFGPVNGEGGERRLNVLFSRARIRCEVFASFDPGDIDPARTTREGPRVLKRFLDFAQTGLIEERRPTGAPPDSPFEEDVARVIRDLGYLADPQVGSAGFRIDLGVRHPDKPGQYLAAVECDGAAYHGALWARERDRLRQDILENLGWRFHRIWSTDWFHRREAEIARLAQALSEAREAARDGIRPRGANRLAPSEAAASEPAPPQPADMAPDLAHLSLQAPPYCRAALPLSEAGEPHDQPTALLADLVAQVIATEGPVHADEVARRIAAAFGKARTGSRISDAVARAVALALRRDDALLRQGAFLMTRAQADDPPVRDRSAEAGPLLKAACLPPVEIAAAARRVAQESGAMTPDQMIRATARLMGFQRVGPELSEAIAAVLLAEAG